jgi:general nucleoside transport system permease protein
MSVIDRVTTSAPRRVAASQRGAGLRRRALRALILMVSAMTLLSLVAMLDGKPDLVSRGSVSAALRFAAPILLAGLGGLWAERSGVINIGLEGMMVVGTWFGAYVGFQVGPWYGVLAGVAAGVVFGLLHALMTVTFGVDQAVSGLAINLLAVGFARFLSSILFEGLPGGSVSQSPQLRSIPTVSLPGAEPILGPIMTARIPVVSDIAAMLLGFTTSLSQVTVLAIALVPLSYLVLWRTRFGLRLRACGEGPAAADALGVDPNRMRYAALAISGGFAGLGGAFLVTVAASIYREGQVAGRGFIGLATVIFGNWMPGRLAGGALLFGFTDALRTRQEGTVHALLLVGAVALVVVGILRARSGQPRSAVGLFIAGAALGAWFVVSDTFPAEFVGFVPHLTTLVVLSIAHQNLRAPVAIGVPYRRSEVT